MATSFLSPHHQQSGYVAATGGGEELEMAAATLDQSVMADRNYVDLSDLLQVAKHNAPTSSGLLDFDYPSLADPQIGLSSITELGSVNKVPLPAELVEQFGHMQCNCMMGLMPEISRAWLSIDSRIFVWNYEDGSDLAYFDGLSETVLTAALLRPRPGIFQPRIHYLLCLTTPVDIVLLGVSFDKPYQGHGSGDCGEMHLLPEPLFSVPTDNVNIVSVQGSDCGRIFMAGKDGCLYELVYQAEDGWFSRKCRKVNHSTSKLSYLVPSFLNFTFVENDPLVQISIDNSRHILYTRSEKGTIQVFDLGRDGQGMSRVAAISEQTTVQNAALVAKAIDRSSFKPIIHISALESSESTNIHLLAVTHTGIRLYFTTQAFHYTATPQPSMLSLVHVRLPPGFSANAATNRPTNVHAAYYSKGTLLLASGPQSEDSDILWTISSDAFPFQRQLRETQETIGIDGRSWAVAEIPSGPRDTALERDQRRPRPPLVVTQHMTMDRRFVVINSQGSYLLNKLRPVDQLETLLLQSGPESDQVEAFFKLHKEQACATCLILATSIGMSTRNVAEMSTRAFFMYGGEPEYNYNAAPTNIGPTYGSSSSYLASPSSPGGLGTGPSPYASPYHNLEPAHMSFQNPAANASTIMHPEVIFSAKHNGLCLYFARLLRPVWEISMVEEVAAMTPNGKTTYLSSRWSSEEISFVLNKLLALREFMEKNSQFTSPLAAESYAAAQRGGQRGDMGMDEPTRRKCQEIADRQETVSLANLQQMVTRSCEALALLNILTDHQFHVVAASLTKDQQNTLRHMNFRTFVTAGKELSSALITCLINMYIDDHAATDAISHRLREVAPSLYSTEDALCSKGSEKLQLAKSASVVEREKHLTESLKLFKEISLHLDLPSVCTQFGQVHYYRGIVDLSLTAAARRDQQGLALHFYKNGEPQEDVHGRQGYMERMECYKCITESLEYLLSTSQAHPQAPSVPRSPGPPPPTESNTLSNTEAAKYAEEVLSLCLQSSDEMFHVALYDWLMLRGLSEKLLEMETPYLEPYLQHGAQQRPTDNLPLLDLLWKYYEKQRNFAAAAKILTKLADRHSTNLGLRQRLEYLSRATMCAKSVTTTSGGQGELLHELEEKMEVARLQMSIYDHLSKMTGGGQEVDEACARLNAELLDITTLYGEFADRFDLCECKLGIIHCAGHYDPTLVESLWHSIIHAELQLSAGRDNKTRMKILHDKLVSLGRVYAASDKYFPRAFLVKLLENYSCELGFDGSNRRFVFTTMQEIGITLSRLLEIYDRLYKSKDSCWKSARKPYHLLYVIHQLLDTFADSPNVVPAYERRAFTTLCLDSVSNYLVELHTEVRSNPDVAVLNNSLKELQTKLERL